MGKTIQMGWLLLRSVSAVRGDLLHWARVQQRFTMRWVKQHGGPSPAFQSEVENGKKPLVLPKKLAPWITALNVTEAFVRGQVSQFHIDPSSCRAAAADIGTLVITGRSGTPDWSVLSERERVREVLRLVTHDSRNLPRVVLAWMLNLAPDTLDALLLGEHPVLRPHLEATVHITTLPETFFTHGSTAQFDQFIPVFLQAVEQRLSPQDLLALMLAPPSGNHSRGRSRRIQDNGPLGPSSGA